MVERVFKTGEMGDMNWWRRGKADQKRPDFQISVSEKDIRECLFIL